MKKIKLMLTGILSFLIVLVNVNAASAGLSVSSSSIYSGESFTAYVNMNGAAAWNLHVTSSGPVSGCTLDAADATFDALDTNKSFPVTCTSTGVGTITLTLSGDVTSANDGNAVNVSGTISVNVTTKPESQPEPTPTPKVTTPEKTKSNDTTIQKFVIKEVENFAFSNSITEYNIEVDEVVDKLDIVISLNDKNAKYDIEGNENLVVGNNEIKVIVTAEDGTTKEFKLNVKINEPVEKDEKLSLKNIEVHGYALNYDKNTYNYELKINEEDKLDIIIDNDAEDVTYEVIGNENLENGSKIEIKVTNGTDTESYFINIVKNQTETGAKTTNIWLMCLRNVLILAAFVGIIFLIVKLKNKKSKTNDLKG